MILFDTGTPLVASQPVSFSQPPLFHVIAPNILQHWHMVRSMYSVVGSETNDTKGGKNGNSKLYIYLFIFDFFEKNKKMKIFRSRFLGRQFVDFKQF